MLIIACKLVKCIETYSYLTRFKNVAFHAKNLFTHYDERAPTTLFASGPPPS